MKEDPRHKNELCERASLAAYFADYTTKLKTALGTVDEQALDQAHHLLESAARAGGRVFAIGNGGSAAISDHLCCDWVKGTHHDAHPTIDALSLSSNVALYSAIANDYGFEQVFATQIKYFGRADDLLVAVSSSGNSPNIIAAVKAAHGIGMKTIGMSGFTGGRLRELVQVSIHVSANNYGVIEDAHQAICHVLAQFIAAGRDS